MIDFDCACGKSLSVKPEFAGKTIDCPYCQQTVVVPSHAGFKASVVVESRPEFGGLHILGKTVLCVGILSLIFAPFLICLGLLATEPALPLSMGAACLVWGILLAGVGSGLEAIRCIAQSSWETAAILRRTEGRR
jgi:hypothetical protein